MDVLILQTDSVLQQFQGTHGDYPEMFQTLLEDEHLNVDVVDVREASPSRAAADGYVITGSRQSVYDDLAWLPAFVDFLRVEIEDGRKVVGICFGHQLIAHFFGGRVEAADVGWAVGVQDTAVGQAHSWMSPQQSSFSIISSHKDQVIELPEGAEVFASTPFCPVSGFTMGNNVITFQGHPEFAPEYAQDLLTHRRELLGEAVYRKGSASFANPVDNRLIATWIKRFLLEGAVA